MSALIEQTFASLPDSSGSTDQVRQLAELIDSDLPLQSFLELLLPQLCQLYKAPAAVAWMKTQGAVFGVRYRMESLLSTIAQQKSHERLVQIVWQQKHPTLAEPKAGAKDNTESSNPTPHRLLFAPILHLGEPIALLEVVLPTQAEPILEGSRQLYLRSAQLLAERVYGGLKRRMVMPQAQIHRAESELQRLTNDLQMLHLQIQRTIETRLAQFQGWSFAGESRVRQAGTLDPR